MGKEIERKFLLAGDSWRWLGEGMDYKQGYIFTSNRTTVRIRVVGDKGYLTIKGPSEGITRTEFEYEIPVADAEDILERLCEKPLIEKKRYVIEHGGLTWEVDEFFGENEGLILAEVELESEDQQIELPDWIGAEVSGDKRYFNAQLVKNPYKTWSISSF